MKISLNSRSAIFGGLAFCAVVFSMISCSKEELSLDQTEKTELQTPADFQASTDESVVAKSTSGIDGGNIAEMPAPMISSVTSSEGLGFGTYSTYLNADFLNQTVLTITGSNFGSTGTLQLLNATGFEVTQLTWGASQIKAKVRAWNTGAAATASAKFKVTVGGLSVEKTFKLVPRIYTRQYRQCTWWASARRQDNSLSVQPINGSYSSTSGSVNADYTPQAKDILIFGTSHQAFIESVSTLVATPAGQPTGTKDYTYTMSISEYNITPEAYSTYSSVVKVRQSPSGVRTILQGSFRSGYASSATKYWR